MSILAQYEFTAVTSSSYVRELNMSRGMVKWFNDAKGYGFISRADGQDVFVHYSSILGDGFRTLNQDQLVDYEERQGPNGLFAASVSKVMGENVPDRNAQEAIGEDAPREREPSSLDRFA